MLRLKDYQDHPNEYVSRKRLEAIKSDLLKEISRIENRLETKHSFSSDGTPYFYFIKADNESLTIKKYIKQLQDEVTEINLMLL